MGKKIAIIGAGIAGLSAGCYGRMNGFDTEIFEMHTVPGGVCTGWKRGGYTFDGCLHWLVGTSPDSALYRMWEELGALKGKTVTVHEAFCRLVTSSGKSVIQYSDIDRFVAELKNLSPSDACRLEQFRNDVKLFETLTAPGAGPQKAGLIRKLRILVKMRKFFALFKRYGMELEEFVKRFEDPDLREALRLSMMLPSLPAVSIVNLLASFDRKQSGWPEGGSLDLARSIERRYLELGGVIRYGAKVEKVLVEDGRAVGVRLSDGSEHRADEVIGAADGRSTIFGMLDGKYVSPELKHVYETFPLYTPFVQVSFGVNRDMKGEPRLTTFGFKPEIAIGETRAPFLMLNNYAFDPTMAPAGKTAVSVLFWSPWDFWEKLRADTAAYGDEKARIERDVRAWLETVYPGIGEDIEVSDVATPLTTVRYTGNYRASYEGWRPTTATMRKQVERTLPGLECFTMIGQWTAPFAGIPSVAKDGKTVVQALCDKYGLPFSASVA